MDLSAIRFRLTNDFQLGVLTFLGAIAWLGISPFVILRAINGEWLAFASDLFILVGILGTVASAWWTGNSHIPSIVVAYFLGTMVVITIYILGAAGMYWFYPVVVATFFLVYYRHAAFIVLLCLFIAMFRVVATNTMVESASFCTTVIVCMLFSYVFAYRTVVQRMQLETLVSKDPLTGLFNHRTLFEDLESARLTFERDRQNYGILLLDLDYFKQVNDKYGHLTGDDVLINLARLLRKQVRQSDRIFRFGGEEFVILFPGVKQKKLALIAEKLRSKVDSELLDPDGNSITISIGGAILRTGESSDDWFKRTDAALYAAKSAGRNCVILEADNLPPDPKLNQTKPDQTA